MKLITAPYQPTPPYPQIKWVPRVCVSLGPVPYLQARTTKSYNQWNTPTVSVDVIVDVQRCEVICITMTWFEPGYGKNIRMVLNLFYEKTQCICSWQHFPLLIYRKKWNTSSWNTRNYLYHWQIPHGCWWHGDTNKQSIMRHGIGIVIPEYPVSLPHMLVFRCW